MRLDLFMKTQPFKEYLATKVLLKVLFQYVIGASYPNLQFNQEQSQPPP
jgi:hypothetical protein